MALTLGEETLEEGLNFCNLMPVICKPIGNLCTDIAI